MSATDVAIPALSPPHSLTDLRGPVWGIDPSTLRIALGKIEPKPWAVGVNWDVLSLAQLKGSGRLVNALRVLTPWFESHMASDAPVRVVVEQPFGKHVHPQSYYMVGVVLVAVTVVTGVEAEVVPPPVWKRLAMGAGHGGATKLQTLHWARSVGYTGGLEDEADAIGIATAAAVQEVGL